jgi:short subunit dehydrogenase-like uncharacterized protein
MLRRGLTPVLAGRTPARLEALAQRLGGESRTARVDVTDPSSLRALLTPDDVLVSTVGPFGTLGDPAVRAAIDAGVIYFDSTGEAPFIRKIFEHFGPQAAAAGAALLPAFGNDYLPGVLAGALALASAGGSSGAAARVDVGYFIAGGGRSGQPFSRGTLNSGIDMLGEPGFAWRGGALRTEPAGLRLRTFDVAGRARPGVSIGSTEHFALPRLAPGLDTVDVYLGWFGGLSYPMHYTARLTPYLAPVLTPLARLVAGRASEEPSAATLARQTSHFAAEVFDRAGRRLARVHLTAPDPYTITAELLAWGAGRAAQQGVGGVGALDPVAAFGLVELTAGAASAGIVEAGVRGAERRP